jgi:hypothetical protein
MDIFRNSLTKNSHEAMKSYYGSETYVTGEGDIFEQYMASA